jgi:hypothetical protein
VRYTTFGSVEGKIELVSIKKSARRFNLTEDRTQRSIRCSLPDELEDSVFAAIRDRRRVIVTGLIGYNAKHDPIRVQVINRYVSSGLRQNCPLSANSVAVIRKLLADFRQKNI